MMGTQTRRAGLWITCHVTNSQDIRRVLLLILVFEM
jgi:hypothetical protein